jgi:hypothetical protein
MEEQTKAIVKKDSINITEQNWLMLKHIREGKKVWEAHQLAGYKGDKSAAYNLWYKLQKKFEMILDADEVGSFRLKVEAKKILDMKVEDRPIKPETKLKAIETLHKLQDKETREAKNISPFIIQKFETGSKSQIQVDKKEIVDIKPIEVEEEKG